MTGVQTCALPISRQLYGRKWGIIGLGAIGHAVAELASAFGCEVAYHSVSGNKRAERYPEKELMELLRWADILSIHSPLNDRIRGLIGAQELRSMKPDSILINVARGGIVDEQALADALDEGVLAGAVVDVFSKEPMPADNPLLRVKDPYKLLLSPHNAWSAKESIDNLVEAIIRNIEEFLRAEKPLLSRMQKKRRGLGSSPLRFYSICSSAYLKSTSDFPVISPGWGNPIIARTVGATSASTPSATDATRSDTTMIGTGLSECAVLGDRKSVV